MPLNRLKDRKLKEIFRYISDINQKAYMNIYLLSNQVLSKKPQTSDYINTYNNNYILKFYRSSLKNKNLRLNNEVNSLRLFNSFPALGRSDESISPIIEKRLATRPFLDRNLLERASNWSIFFIEDNLRLKSSLRILY